MCFSDIARVDILKSKREPIIAIALATMLSVYSCLRLATVRSKITIMPPPSTVSIVRARRLGVTASKSCKTHIP